MRKILINLLISSSFLFCGATISAQSYLGIVNSNYAGVTGMELQPASIVDSRYRFDISLFGLSSTIANNYVGLEPKGLFNPNPDLNFEKNYLSVKDLENDKNAKASINTKIQLLTFMATISDKSALGVSIGFRNFITIDNVSEELAKVAFTGLVDDTFIPNVQIDDDGLSVDNMTWMEYGLTYAHTLYNTDNHFIKGGVTAKLVHAVSSGYLYASNLDYSFVNDSIIDIAASDFNYGHSDNLNNLEFDSIGSLTKLSFAGVGPSFDLGLVYEYRPNIDEFRRKKPDGTFEYDNTANKYKFRFGVSLLDVGRVKFKKGNNSGDFGGSNASFNVNQFSLNSIPAFDDTIQANFNPSASNETEYTVSLPSVLSMQFDYNIKGGFYVNVTPYIALNRDRDPTQSRVSEITTISLTPRYESRWFDVGVPLSYNEYNNTNLGLSLRVGPIIVGTNDILPLVGKKTVYGSDFHVAVKIPIAYGQKKDTDEDGVPDVADVCPDQPGLPELDGCPDKDGDGIADAGDACPLEAGLAKFNGCPDTDGDEVKDSDDACPTIAGSLQHKGCPDSDKDGLYDNEDSCPSEAGPLDNKGCPYPDTDKDGVKDSDDKCPNVSGPASNDGCPITDIDKDGIPDKDDKCPTVAGPVENSGCPLNDKDGDSIPDKDDKCPSTPGLPELNGCPKLEEKEEAILKVAFDNLEFETGKDIIRASSYASLNELANLLINKPSYGLRIAGHTDNVGSDKSNMTLSSNRATSVKNYLISKGVKAEKLVTEYYGETKPIGDNATAEGRQLNRRVEMNVIFE
ncbi:MAG: OmpA family protein [Chitinophagales bacterium]|nr:OmpA family protein [Bacteroidota bacterium]MBK7569476.1 OmpA family protein [Bacteroidota bacterium]MBP9220044.1 OmpA family protein [Chitinophagales bacterium]